MASCWKTNKPLQPHRINPVSAHHVRAPSKIFTMHSGAQTLTGVDGDLILDKHYYGIRTAKIQTRHWWIFDQRSASLVPEYSQRTSTKTSPVRNIS
jgi:hypothetical protein